MAADQSTIPPFPANLDRDAFGHWLSGFTDGEGCFRLGFRHLRRPYPSPEGRFCIQLRADEEDIVRLVQSYFRCGTVSFCEPNRGKEKRVVRLHVNDFRSLAEIVVPHFERYPLRAKKRHDFMIWKEGIGILYRVGITPRITLGGRRGFPQRWFPQDLAEFRALHDALKTQREYKPPSR